MPSTVIVNFRGVAHKRSNGFAIAFPDVCKTPSPGGPVPIPYPNNVRSSDTADGPKSIKTDGAMPMVKGSNYRISTGDEGGTAGGGVVSSKIKSKGEFILYSFNVKFEGRNVCRLGDPLFHNNRNAIS